MHPVVIMAFRDPIPLDRLTQITRARRGDPEVIALLWEIKRMQSLLLRADQLFRSPAPWTGAMDSVWNELKGNLDHEPVVQWHRDLIKS